MSNFNVEMQNSGSPGKSGGIGGMIFLILFATPFAGFGLLAVVQGIKKLIAGETKDGLMLCLFGLIFSGVGFGLMLGAVRARKKAKQTAELQARFADQPWRLRPDWAAGRIKSSDPAQTRVYAIMAAAFCGIGGVATFFVCRDELPKGNHLALLVLIFPLVGIGFAAAVVRALLARRRYGECVFEPAQVPLPVGGVLEGLIQTGARFRPEHGLHLKLSCIRRTVSGSGKNRHVSEEALWQDEKVLKPGADLPEPAPDRTAIPVHFKLPDGQPQCFARGDVSVGWRLEARAKMAGPDFSATFDVPVFKLADAAVPAADEPDPTASLQMPVEELRRDEHSKIQVTDGPDGREFYFPAARNPGAAVFTTVLALICDGAFVLTIRFQAPVLIPIFLGLFGLLASGFAFSLWFKSGRVTIDSSRVRVVNRWLFFGRARQFAAGDVAQFAIRAGMQSGSQVYLDIKLITRADADSFEANKAKYQQTGQLPPMQFRVGDPRGVTVASGIASVAEANWLVQEMTRALGRPA
jgi:hypothetical protein